MQVLRKIFFTFLLVSSSLFSIAQRFYAASEASGHWVDSVFSSLTPQQRIAQLMVVRLSEKTSSGPAFYNDKLEQLIRNYDIGSICLFQGGPVKQANYINYFQQIAQTPLM